MVQELCPDSGTRRDVVWHGQHSQWTGRWSKLLQSLPRSRPPCCGTGGQSISFVFCVTTEWGVPPWQDCRLADWALHVSHMGSCSPCPTDQQRDMDCLWWSFIRYCQVRARYGISDSYYRPSICLIFPDSSESLHAICSLRASFRQFLTELLSRRQVPGAPHVFLFFITVSHSLDIKVRCPDIGWEISAAISFSFGVQSFVSSRSIWHLYRWSSHNGLGNSWSLERCVSSASASIRYGHCNCLV